MAVGTCLCSKRNKFEIAELVGSHLLAFYSYVIPFVLPKFWIVRNKQHAVFRLWLTSGVGYGIVHKLKPTNLSCWICFEPLEAYHVQVKSIYSYRIACGYCHRCNIDGDITSLASGSKEAGFEFGLPFQRKDSSDGMDYVRRR
jgi:hypothetical protein